MASPHAAGAAALYRSGNPPDATPEGVRTALQATGNAVWSEAGDPDGIHEQLLNVDAL
jgi:subtilisin family serine protease